jgi:hypothetical protein
MTDFVNLKIKPIQSFRGAYRSRMCVHVFIGVSARTCISIYVYIMFLKKDVFFWQINLSFKLNPSLPFLLISPYWKMHWNAEGATTSLASTDCANFMFVQRKTSTELETKGRSNATCLFFYYTITKSSIITAGV